MRLKHVHRTVGAAIALAMVIAILSVGTARSVSWNLATDVSQSEDIRTTDRVDVAAGPEGAAVIWANSAVGEGVTVAREPTSGNRWLRSHPGILPWRMAWAPTLEQSGTQIAAAWVEGETAGVCDTEHWVVAYDVGGTKQTFDPIYSPATAPDIAVGDTGWHMVFAGSTTEADCLAGRANLYYSHRASASQLWSDPTVIVTHSAVLENAVQGGIWHPRIATVPGSSAIHVVWEQFRLSQEYVSDTGVWVISKQNNGAPWGTPLRLSPEAQKYAVRPVIDAGTSGNVHVAWTLVVGNKTNPTEQHVYYRRLQSTTPTILNPEPIRVNGDFPTLASSSIAAQGNTVCATWHGYIGDQGAGREEITTRCSRDGGSTWQNPINVSESSNLLSILPASDIDEDGLYHFAWTEYELASAGGYQPYAVFYRNSDETGVVYLPLVMRGR